MTQPRALFVKAIKTRAAAPLTALQLAKGKQTVNSSTPADRGAEGLRARHHACARFPLRRPAGAIRRPANAPCGRPLPASRPHRLLDGAAPDSDIWHRGKWTPGE